MYKHVSKMMGKYFVLFFKVKTKVTYVMKRDLKEGIPVLERRKQNFFEVKKILK